MRQRVFVETRVGRLAVDQAGSDAGSPAALLWQSLFMDERSWQRLLPLLPQDRRYVVVTGPGHGASGDPGRRYTLAACADAAAEVLDTLGITEPVDWVGNAWGGHVGVVYAVARPARIRSLVTICSPIQQLSRAERWQTRSLLLAHRLVGPAGFIVDAVSEAMLSPASRKDDPEALALVRDSVRSADPRMLRNAVSSISLHREGLASLLPLLGAPTLMITGGDDRGWTPEQLHAAVHDVPDGQAAVVPGAAYLAPFEQPASVARLVDGFWASLEAAEGRIER